MIIKKSFLGLVVAASLASVGAHAWTNGDFNGEVNIGGNIVSDNYSQKWAWAVGSGLDNFSNNISDMTDNGKRLSISVSGNKAILLGKTNEAFWAPSVGVGAVPNISFTDYNGNDVPLNEKGTDGKVSLSFPFKERNGDELGSLSVNAVAVGYMATGSSLVNLIMLNSMSAADSGKVFFGGVQKTNSNAIQGGKDAANKVAEFGGVTFADLVTQLSAVHNNLTGLSINGGYVAETDWTRPIESDKFPDSVATSGYALGIETGQTIELTFNQQLTKTTDWVAPLNILVAYQ